MKIGSTQTWQPMHNQIDSDSFALKHFLLENNIGAMIISFLDVVGNLIFQTPGSGYMGLLYIITHIDLSGVD